MNTVDYALPHVQEAQQALITKVYGWMCLALAITALVAMYTASAQGLLGFVYQNRIVFFGLIIAELVAVVFLTARIHKMSALTATSVFIAYSILNGLTLSVIFVLYTGASIASTFFVTAGTFGIMSFYGYVTKRDLTTIGNLAFMALIGLIIASLVNLFLHNQTLYWIVTFVGVLVFVGLTAYDTQKIKQGGFVAGEGEETERKNSIIGALRLYLDFINLFLMLLRIMGRRN
nr:Bax inhibitor-1/YccA family protein [candidate division Zixibacteria bacterium]